MARKITDRIRFYLCRAYMVEEAHWKLIGNDRTGTGVMRRQNIGSPAGTDKPLQPSGNFS